MAPRHVVAIAAEIFGREFPVARHDPFVHAADHLDAALATVKEGVEIPGHFAEILAQRWRLGIEGGEVEALVAVELRYRFEAPLVSLQFVVVGLLEPRHTDQPPVIAVGPTVIGTGEAGGVAGIGAAQTVAAMAADVEEGAYLPAAVMHHENRVFTH